MKQLESMTEPLRRIRTGAMILAGIFVLGVLGYRLLGGYSWTEAVWMVVITISTVGYSEQSESADPLKWLTIGVIFFGMTASVYTFGGLFQLILAGELDQALRKRRMIRQIERLSGHVIVCGYGRMGQHLVSDLRHHRIDLVVIDLREEIVEQAIAEGLLAVQGNATDDDLLTAVGVKRAKTLVTSLPDDADSVFITLTARNLNPALKIVARAEQKTTEKKLRQAGANRVVLPTIVGAKQMVRLVTRPSTADLMDLVTESSYEAVELDEIKIGASSPLGGKRLREIESLAKHNLLIIGIERSASDLHFNPKGDVSLQAGETIMVIGHPHDILSFRKEATDD